jgi:hypothetical protein
VSIIHRPESDELSDTTLAELYSMLGEGDTPLLYQEHWTLDTDHDIPAGGGNSLDRKTKYIDRTLYQEVMDGEFKRTGLTPEQIISRWCDHEHSEKCIADGDNPCDTYMPCHNRALTKEHVGVCNILVPKGKAAARKIIDNYEAVIWPGLSRCYHRDFKKPPKDLWCAPHLDDPTPRDEEILNILRKLGVIDAAKHSKLDVRYGYGKNRCEVCRGWLPELISQEHGRMAGCKRVSGIVRCDRYCDLWHPRET